MHIAENLKSLRKEKELTQEEAAEILGVSPQSVSKWERGDSYPDITLLPTLANLYKTSIDSLIGMDKINNEQARSAVFAAGHKHMKNGDINNAISVYSDALKTFPNDEGIMSDLAMAMALDGSPEKLKQAITFCERVLSSNQSGKVHHTTRAALCFIYAKSGEGEKAVAIAEKLPHMRESREVILAELEKNLSIADIDKCIMFIGFGGYT